LRYRCNFWGWSGKRYRKTQDYNGCATYPTAPAAGFQRLSIAPAAGSQGKQRSTGHRGSLAVMVARRPPAVRPVCSIAYAAIAYFLGSCCAFRQLLLAFWANWGFWLPVARTGAGRRSEPRARWEGPYGTRGGRAAAAAAAAAGAAEPAAAAEAAARPRGAAGRFSPLRGAAGRCWPLRGAAGRFSPLRITAESGWGGGIACSDGGSVGMGGRDAISPKPLPIEPPAPL